MDAHAFREDLYHRLSVILIHVPPLRERRDDVPAIAAYLLGQVARRNGIAQKAFAPEALDRMKRLEWRGNVRELRNVVERLLILSEGDTIEMADVDRYVRPGGAPADPLGALLDEFDQFADFRDQAERIFIERKLTEFGWNVSKTAEAIGIQRSHLYNKLREYDIARPDEG